MYTGRRRRYYPKKYYRNRLFAPSMRKANMPNFYQMKGRIIQQTPKNIKNSETELITQDNLEKYYQLLVQYKYSFPTPPSPPPFDPTNYTFVFDTTPILFSNLTDNFEFDKNYFNTILINTEKPDPPTGYSYHFDVVQVYYEVATISNDESNFSIEWNSNFLTSNTANLFNKTNASSTISESYTLNSMALPKQTGKALVYYGTVQSSSITISQSTVDTNGILDVNAIPYALVTSDTTSDTYGSKIIFKRTVVGTQQDKFSLYFRFLAYLKAD